MHIRKLLDNDRIKLLDNDKIKIYNNCITLLAKNILI